MAADRKDYAAFFCVMSYASMGPNPMWNMADYCLSNCPDLG